MILLIHLTDFQTFLLYEKFKFHYDSINSSILWVSPNYPLSYLNSIMILLILKSYMSKSVEQSNLNSIMILLIPKLEELGKRFKDAFKFHYDSINSVALIDNSPFHSLFKFHYDSINSNSKFFKFLFYKFI